MNDDRFFFIPLQSMQGHMENISCPRPFFFLLCAAPAGVAAGAEGAVGAGAASFSFSTR